jgi:hypothetical protein
LLVVWPPPYLISYSLRSRHRFPIIKEEVRRYVEEEWEKLEPEEFEKYTSDILSYESDAP